MKRRSIKNLEAEIRRLKKKQHNTKEQRIKDCYRTKDLESLGYKVYRITNEEVYHGLTTALLYKAYRNTKEVG